MIGTIDAPATEITVDKSVTIKGGTLKGANIKVAANSGANVTFDGVTFKETNGTDASSINVRQGNGNVTIKNCTFDKYAYDAIQVYNTTDVANTITIENNVFKRGTENADGSIIHIAAEHNQNSAKIVIKGNTFETFEGFTDNPIKIYGMKKFSQVTVGGNVIPARKNIQPVSFTTAEIIISTKLYEGSLTNDNTYSIIKAFEAFNSANEVTLNDAWNYTQFPG